MGTYTELSLFTGYGGFSLGLRLTGLAVQTVCYVELDGYCQRIIQARIQEGLMDDAPIWDDIATFDGKPWRGHVDIITGGFPCQPHSVAGQRRGADDERNLWPATLRVIREVGPRYVLLENVPGLLSPIRGAATGYVATVVGELSEAGYDCVWDCVSAAEVGAPHKRERWWCLAYASGRENDRRESRNMAGAESRGQGFNAAPDSCGETLAYSRQQYEYLRRQWLWVEPTASGEILADAQGVYAQRFTHRQGKGQSRGGSWWSVEPDVGRVANGVASRVDRLRALGNGIVPAVVREFLIG